MRYLIPALLTLAAPAALALHSGNAGPKEFEIKFKLPPPPVLSPEEALKALRAVLTPMEREQFAEASRTEKSCDPSLAEQVCRDFIARLRHI